MMAKCEAAATKCGFRTLQGRGDFEGTAGLTVPGKVLMMSQLAHVRREPQFRAGIGRMIAVSHLLPPRSMVGQLTLDQHIGVRIPGGQPL